MVLGHFPEKVGESPGRLDMRILAPADLKKSLFVSEIRLIEDVQRVQIKFPLHILGPVKLKISPTHSISAKLLCQNVLLF